MAWPMQLLPSLIQHMKLKSICNTSLPPTSWQIDHSVEAETQENHDALIHHPCLVVTHCVAHENLVLPSFRKQLILHPRENIRVQLQSQHHHGKTYKPWSMQTMDSLGKRKRTWTIVSRTHVALRNICLTSILAARHFSRESLRSLTNLEYTHTWPSSASSLLETCTCLHSMRSCNHWLHQTKKWIRKSSNLFCLKLWIFSKNH